MSSFKPTHTLTKLEEEPESGFYGCTQTEITGALKKAVIAAAIFSAILAIVVRWEAAIIIGILLSAGVFMFFIKCASSNRADKPLYYHKHIIIFKTSQFIQPARFYQRERNTNASKK